ncbi:MAG: high-affinity nickel-transport family protein [Candidatus Methylomirabilia bacterium]
MGSLLAVIGLGFLLGLQHATDPDHVVAVATIVSRSPRLAAGALIGAFWGVGHTLTVAVVGGAIIFLNVTIAPTVSLSLELLVALMLVALGVLRLSWTWRDVRHVSPECLVAGHEHGHGNAFHSHPHTHDGVTHRHPHLHAPRLLLAALETVGPAQALRSTAVGLVHGLAGSAAVALLVLSAIGTPHWALLYLGAFGLGTLVGMMALTAALVIPFALGEGRFGRFHRALAAGTALLSIGVGLVLAYEVGIVEGLFTGSMAQGHP